MDGFWSATARATLVTDTASEKLILNMLARGRDRRGR